MKNTIFLVRHGENKANLTKELSHRLVDYPLTEKGFLQARQTADYFLDKQIDEIYASPLKRAAQTAEVIATHLSLPMTIVEEFREVNVGSLEGRPVTEALWQEHNAIIHGWFDGRSDLRFPEGESHQELVARFTQALAPILAKGLNRRIMLVGHGGTFLLSAPTLCPDVGFSYLRHIENSNCSISEVQMPEMVNGGFNGTMVRWADVRHLRGYAAELVSGVPKLGELKN